MFIGTSLWGRRNTWNTSSTLSALYARTLTSMSAASAPGIGGGKFTPVPPQKGSFPVDHDGECTHLVEKYLKCIKLAGGQNSATCRGLAKDFLECRMKNDLMDYDDWENLGFKDENGSRAPPKD